MRKIKRHYRIKRKKSIFKNRFFWEGSLFFLEISFIFYLLIFSQTFQIEKVYILGNNKEVQNQDLQNFLQEKIRKISPFSMTNIFLLSSKKLEEKILEKFPEIDIVEIKKKFPNILDVEIKEKVAVAIFCPEGEPPAFLDKKGVIFEKKGSFNENLPLIKSQTLEKKINFGEVVIKREILEKILRIAEFLKTKLNIEAKEYVLAEKSRLNVKTSQGWEIFFDLNNDLDLQILKLKLLLEKEILPENVNLQYIDLRFTRVYYK